MLIRRVKACLIAASAALLVSCSSTPNVGDFRKMSSPELIAYNRTVEFWDQVYCADEIRAGTYIRRRYCETYMELQDRLTKAASSLNVLSTTRIY